MDILLDQKTEDLVLIGGDLSFVNTRQQELMQRLYLRLKTFKREWFLDLNYGVDYLNDVFGVNVSKIKIDTIFQTEILKDVLVSSLISYESQIQDYKYSANFVVKSTTFTEVITYYVLVNENSIILTDNLNNKLTTRL